MKLLQVLEGASFGLADGVICALGIIMGVAAATSSATTVIIVGVIGGVADAFGNSIGFYISQLAERGVQTYESREHGEKHKIHTVEDTIVSGIASFIVTIVIFGLLLVPYLFLQIVDASIVSFAVGAVILACLGAYVARLSKESIWKTGLWYACIGLVGAVVSYWIGLQLKAVFGIK
jgi:predicted membrane protein (TIGR00267 family)